MAPHPLASVRQLALREGVASFDLELHRGRVVGLAGLEGHGQGRFLEVLAGVAPASAGTVVIDGREVRGGFRTISHAYQHGIVYVPRDRKVEGLFPHLSVLENFALPTLHRSSTLGVIQRRQLLERYEHYARALGITASNERARIGTLSGGNQQKVLLARWLAAEPELLLLNDPSRGVDHGTKLALQRIYHDVAKSGSCVVLLSTEIEELLLTADEVVVFREHALSATLREGSINRQAILAAMFGAAHA